MTTVRTARAFTGRSIKIFFVVLIVLSALLDAILIRADKMDAVHGFVIHGEMWVPGLAALAACVLGKVSLRELGWEWPATRWAVAGYGIPVVYGLIAYTILWATHLAALDLPAFAKQTAALNLGASGGTLLAIVLTLSFGVVQSLASASGEEIGWRGFLAPTLAERMSFWPMALVSGLIWASWHMPLVLLSDYHGTAPFAITIGSFAAMIVSTGAIYAWMRLKSRSLWPAAIAHASHNAVIQWMFDPMTVEDGRAGWYAGEFGIVLAVVCVLVAAVLILRYPPNLSVTVLPSDARSALCHDASKHNLR